MEDLSNTLRSQTVINCKIAKVYNLIIFILMMGITIGLISIKGGVGKTTLSSALAADLACNHKKKILLVDANYSAPNLGIHMNIISPKKTIHDVLAGNTNIKEAIHNQYGVDVVPGNFLYKRDYYPLRLRNKLSEIKKNYDFIIIDGSPSLNDEVLSTILASDKLFIVTTADYPTLSCSMKAAKLAKERNKSIVGIILNKSKNKNQIKIEEIQESTGIPVVAKIKEDDVVDFALFKRVPSPLFAKKSYFAKEINKLSEALIGKKEKRSILSLIFSRKLSKEQVNREILRQNFYKSMFE